MEMIEEDGFNSCTFLENGKLFNQLDSCGEDYIYLEIENNIIKMHLYIQKFN
jgi:hypothetical protein